MSNPWWRSECPNPRKHPWGGQAPWVAMPCTQVSMGTRTGGKWAAGGGRRVAGGGRVAHRESERGAGMRKGGKARGGVSLLKGRDSE